MVAHKEPLILNIGGGLNSSALLVEYVRRGLPYGVALFADTGNEHDETYRFLAELDAWLVSRGRAPITRVTNALRPDGTVHKYKSLEEECVGNKTLPSLAFGFRGCSKKWKVQPMDRWIKSQEWARATWARGDKVVRAIGYDMDEPHRTSIPEDKKFRYIYPLRDWGFGRDECADAIKRAGLPVCGKSACWFCPATRKSEVLALSKRKRHLYERGVAMERNAAPSLGTVQGLGRAWSWEKLVKADEAQMRMWPEVIEPCMYCWDGEDECDVAAHGEQGEEA